MLSRRPALLPLLAAVCWELLVAVGAADLSTATTSQDACDEKGHVILDDWRRTPLYQPRSPRDVLCDRHLRPGWYRFTLQNRSAEIPTQCASVNYCGTQAPLWLHLKGRKLPAANSEANFTACASWSLLDGHDADHCCSLQLPVTVRNCSQFLVYYLTPTPGCNMAYCAHLAAGALPFTFDGVPSVHPYIDDKKQIFLNCSVRHRSSAHQSVQFRFSWYRISGKDSTQTLLRTQVSSNPQDLLSRNLFSVADRIICEVEALLDVESNHHDVINPSVSSSPFHAGITAEPTYVTLYKNGSVHNVSISITMPFVCGTHVSSHDCHFSLNLDQKSTNQLQSIGISHCHLDLGSVDFEQARQGQFNVSLSAVNDYIHAENSTVPIQLTLTSYGDSWWHGFTAPNITVKVVDIHPSQCYAFTLGHIITTDSFLKRIDSKGTYLLYGNPAQNLKVFADYQDCAGGGSESFCVCAVKITYHQDEFQIDHCSNEILPEHSVEYFSSVRKQTLPEISLKSQNGTKKLKTWESRQGKLLTVVMETGSRVRIRIEPWGLSVSIIDGTVTDELKPLVSGLCTERSDSDDLPITPEENELCFCWPSKDLSCDPEFEFCPPTCQNWSPVRWNSFFNYIDITSEALVRNKESDSEDSSSDKRLRRHGSDTPVYSTSLGKDIYWTTRSRRSLENIRDDDVFLYCSNYLVNSTIAIECGQFLNAAIMKAIEICMKDVTTNADNRWATFSLGLLEDQCEVEAQFQQSQWPRDVLNQPVLPKSIVEALNCPNGCSGHGVCLDLGCVCQPGFSSLDCSIIDERPPQLTTQGFKTLCDSSSRNCSRLSITGSTFIDSSQLTCRYWYGGLSQNSSWIRESPTHHSRAIFDDASSVTCELDKDFTKVYEEIFVEIQVSNDNSRFSQSLFVSVFDGRCRACSQDDNNATWPVCTDREDVCVLDDQCFFDNEVNPKNSCQACKIEQSEQWSINESNLPPVVLADIKIVVYDGQDLVYHIPASDPDSDSLSYSLLDPVTDVAIDQTGRFRWRAVSNSLSVINREVFYIRISDNCNPPLETRLEIDVFPCPCDNGGSCATQSSQEEDSDSNVIPTYVCNCPAGFTGKDCNMRIDPCASNPCIHGSCFPTATSVVCRCDPGFSGELCDKSTEVGTILNPTEPRLDDHDSTRLIDIDVQVLPVMEDLEDSWNQSLPLSAEDFETEWNSLPGFCSQPCKNGGICVFPGICKCPLGQRGSKCHVNQCYPPCGNGGRCLKRNRCKCKEGFRGPGCESKAPPKCYPPCQNKGKCIADNVCQCRPGWAGDQCNIPLCEPPCQNGGVCWRPGKCACPHGYRGSRCTKPVCSPPCQNGGKCLSPGICKCKTAFGGSVCEISLKKARRKTLDHRNVL